MINKFLSLSLALLACLLVSCAAPIPTPEPAPDKVASADIPDPFWDFNPESNFTINYADVDAILVRLELYFEAQDDANHVFQHL